MGHRRHVLLVTFPAQGHINPTLQFANRLITMGVDVTFVASMPALSKMAIATSNDRASNGNGLTFVGFSDGFDDGFKPGMKDGAQLVVNIRDFGSKCLKDTIVTSAELGRPVTCVVYTLLLPWASEVAKEANIPFALLWIQPPTVMNVYYWYFHGYKNEIGNMTNSDAIRLPGIETSFSRSDIPSFLLPSDSQKYALPMFDEQLRILDEASSKPKGLVNTFDALERDALKAIDKYESIGIGPLIPSAFLSNGDNIPRDKSTRGDLFQESVDYIDWLNSKPRSSIVYLSFGSLLTLLKKQMEEIGKGLLKCGRPFLWVMRENKSSGDWEEDEKLSCLEQLQNIGKMVSWCSQLEVLKHSSLGCFVTHCGWNSTLESMSCGVLLVAFPRWTDQGTNAKLIEDVWKVGVRVRVNEDNGLVESDEIWRCIEEVMDSSGTKGNELRENTKEWKYLAREAMKENSGSSYMNLKTFLDAGHYSLERVMNYCYVPIISDNYVYIFEFVYNYI